MTISMSSHDLMFTRQPLDEDESGPYDEHSVAHAEIGVESTTIPTLFMNPVPPPSVWQTMACLQALLTTPESRVHFCPSAIEKGAVAEIKQPVVDDYHEEDYHDNDDDDEAEDDENDLFNDLMVSPGSIPSCFMKSCLTRNHPWTMSSHPTPATPPVSARRTRTRMPNLASPPRPLRLPYLSSVEPIGPAHAQVYKVTLPPQLVSLLDPLVAVAEAHAQQSPKNGWNRLYALTRQDLAVAAIPGGIRYSRPVVDYLTTQMQILFRHSGRPIWMDRNQPHLCKYTAHEGWNGVGVHTDACDVTANLMMSRPTDYYGGGTWLGEPVGRTIHLKQGECLLHPGSLLHAGQAIHSGSRYLMVMFAFLEPPTVTSHTRQPPQQYQSGGP